MDESFYDNYSDGDEYEWKQSARGNHVCIHDGKLLATVYSNGVGPWQIIVNRSDGGYLVGDEAFDTAEEAMCRAAEVLDGVKFYRIKLTPR